jgi:Family of unknown function (DUF6882)
MDNYNTFVTDSLNEYDKNIREQRKLLKDATYFDYIKFDNDIENDKVIFYNDNNEKLLEADFEAISSYEPQNSLWTWGWSQVGWRKKWTRIINKILSYGLSLDPQKDFHLKLELVNSRFTISDPIQIDIHLAIASALSKIPNIYPFIIPSKLSKFGIFPDIERYDILKEYDGKYRVLYLFLFNIKKIEKV